MGRSKYLRRIQEIIFTFCKKKQMSFFTFIENNPIISKIGQYRQYLMTRSDPQKDFKTTYRRNP